MQLNQLTEELEALVVAFPGRPVDAMAAVAVVMTKQVLAIAEICGFSPYDVLEAEMRAMRALISDNTPPVRH